ncbi:wax ester/triacylglycerol synthase family O-acyltransferase [soil metagenome]
MSAPDQMSAVDAAWWKMEDPTNPMTITAVFTFAEPLDAVRLRDLLEHRLMAHDRFRQRVVPSDSPFGAPSWWNSGPVPVSDHLREVVLREGADRAELEELVGVLMSTPLDPERPLWEFHHVRNYRGGSALVARVHHCIGDGLGLMQLMLQLDEQPSEAKSALPVRRRDENGSDGFGLLAAPRLAGSVARVLGRLLAMPADPPTRFKGPLGTRKRAAWSEPIPLDDVKFIGRRVGGTVNDVLLSAVAGALRSYLCEHGSLPEGRSLRGVIPVNLRGADELDTLGNKFGLVFLSLPVGTADARERLRAVHASMDALKRSPEALVVYGLLRTFGRAVEPLLDTAVSLLGSKATAVMTNVPGPREPVYFCGQPIRSIMFWVPQSGHLGLGVSVLSYAGEVRIGVATDAGLVPDPEAIVAAYQEAVGELMREARSVAAGIG